MKNKFLILPILIVTMLFFTSSFCFASENEKVTSTRIGNEITSSIKSGEKNFTGNVILKDGDSGKAKEDMEKTGNDIKDGVKDAGNTVKDGAKETGNAIKDGAEDGKNMVENGAEHVKNGIEDAKNNISNDMNGNLVGGTTRKLFSRRICSK